MQQLLTGILLIALHASVIAQSTTENLSLKQPGLKILYRDVPNEIRVIDLEPKGKIELKTDNPGSTIRRIDNTTFNVSPEPPAGTRTEVLKIYSDGKLSATDTYEVRKIPNPEVRLGSINDSAATISQIIENPELHVVFPNSHLKHNCEVRSFELIVKHGWKEILILPFEPDHVIFDTIYTVLPTTGKDTMMVFKSSGATFTETNWNRLTEKHLNHIMYLNKGDKLIFKTTTRCPDSQGSITLSVTII